MGFKVQRKIYKLVFEDPELEGLEVRTRSLPLGVFMEDFSSMGDLQGKKKLSTEEQKEISGMFEQFAGCLVSWNLEEEDGSPVPADLKGLYSQDIDFVFTIIAAWMDAIADVSDPLKEKLNSGGTSLVESLPMETLSENQVS